VDARPANKFAGNYCQVHLRGLSQSPKGDFAGVARAPGE